MGKTNKNAFTLMKKKKEKPCYFLNGHSNRMTMVIKMLSFLKHLSSARQET